MGRLVQEAPDQRQPDAVDRQVAQESEARTGADHHDRNDPPGGRRDPGGLREVVGAGPDRGPQHPSAVHGKTRKHVERSQQEVDRAERPEQRRPRQGTHLVRHQPEPEQEHPEHHRQRRPGQRDLRLVACRRGLPRDLGGSAEEEERDAVDGDPLALRHDRVRQFVGEQRGEEEDGSHEAEHHRPGSREAGRPGRKPLAEDKGDQPREEEPGRVEEDFYPQDPAEPDTSPLHRLSSALAVPGRSFRRLPSIRALPAHQLNAPAPISAGVANRATCG